MGDEKSWWDGLCDAELQARLEQRHHTERDARWLVQHRDGDEHARDEIDRELGR